MGRPRGAGSPNDFGELVRLPTRRFIEGVDVEVLDWFHREPPRLGAIPLALLDDPVSYPRLINAATEPRSMPL